MPSLRTLLLLARASNLPTVWSNCLAAWWLGGGGALWSLFALMFGASLLYTGGMFLNDAVDANFDRQHRRERPIPSGQISERLVWRLSAFLIGSGALLVILLGVLSSRPIAVPDPFSEVRAAERAQVLPASSIGEMIDEGPAFRKGTLAEADAGSPIAERRRTDGIKHPALTLLLTLALVALVVLYDFIHKAATFSPILMGACRTFLVLAGASVGRDGLTGLAAWGAVALGTYVAGLSYFARLERMLRRPQWWPCLLLAVPVGLALVINNGSYQRDALMLSLILGLWIVRSLRPALGSSQQNVSRSVAALLAGIVFVDLLAVCGAPRELSFVFLGLFGLTLLFQKYIPAT